MLQKAIEDYSTKMGFFGSTFKRLIFNLQIKGLDAENLGWARYQRGIATVTGAKCNQAK